MASKSPSYALLLGNQYLGRASNDAALAIGSNITISVTFDPNAFGAATNGTIAGKDNASTSQRAWRIEYISSSGTIRCTLFGNASGTIYVTRESTAVIRFRTNVTFAYTLAGTLNCYVNGTLSNGTTTSAGTMAALATSTEPLSIGADSRTGSVANVWRGAVYMLAVLSSDRSADVTGMVADGVINATLAAHGSLVVYWRHTSLVSANNSDFSSWNDIVSSRALTSYIVSGVIPVKVQSETGAILARNLWDANLTDQALGATGLSTTYTLAFPYRLWGAALPVPQISSGYRSFVPDLTVLIRCRKVTGRTTAVLVQTRGINLQFVLSNREMYAIIGDDTSATLQNRRISWGFNLFPVEGVDAVIVIRYNAVEKDADLFVNQVKYTQVSNVATNSSETTTGILLSDSSDFTSAGVHHGCLDDGQVDKFILGLAQLVYPAANLAVLYTLYVNTPITAIAALSTAAALARETPVTVPFTTLDAVNAGNFLAVRTLNTTSPYTIKDTSDPYDRTFTDPLPTIISASFSAGVLTVVGAAGPTNAFHVRTWWEIEGVSGQTYIQGSNTYPRDVITSRATFSDAFSIPSNWGIDGLNLRFCVQPQLNAKTIWRSAPVTVSAGGGGYVDPVASITSAVIDVDGKLNVVLNAGPTNAGTLSITFEIEQTIAGTDYIQVSPVYSQVFASNGNLTVAFIIGSRTGWTSKRVRAVLSVVASPGSSYTTAGYSLTDYAYTNPNPTISTVTVSPARVVSASGAAGATNVGPCNVWWELEVTPSEFIGILDKRLGVDLSSATSISDTFTIPPNFTLTGKKLRLAVQPVSILGDVFYSSIFTLSDATLTNPIPTITVASCSLLKLLTASASLSTSNAGPVDLWWEVDNDTGHWTSLIEKVSSVAVASGQTRTLSYQLPNRLSLTGKNLRLVIQSTVVPTQFWYSPSFAISQVAAIDPTLTISVASMTTLGSFTGTGQAIATNLGVVTSWWEIAYTAGKFDAMVDTKGTVSLNSGSVTALTASFTCPADAVGKSVRLAVRSNVFPELVYYSASFTVTAVAVSAPTPLVTTANFSASGNLTLAGTISANNVGAVDYWFESDLQGGGQFSGKFLQVSNVTIASGASPSGTVVTGRLSLSGVTVRLAVRVTNNPAVVYYSPSFSVATIPLQDPLPTITSASFNQLGVFTALGAAGPTDLGSCTSWFEVEYTAGKFRNLLDVKTTPDLSSVRQSITGSVNLPVPLSFAGKQVRLAVQSAALPDLVYYSANFTPQILTFQINTQPPGTVNSAAAQITAATVSVASAWTATVVLSVNNLGAVLTWFEIEVVTGEFTVLIDPTPLTLNPSGQTITSTSTLPDRFDLQGKMVRFVIQPVGRPDVLFYTALHAIVADTVSDPGPQIQSWTATVFRQVSGTVRAGPTNAAFCKVWWEVLIDSDLIGRFDSQDNVNLFSQQIIANSFQLPRGKSPSATYNYTSGVVRFAVQTNLRPELVFYSPPQALNIPAVIDPAPVVASATANPAHVGTLTGYAGPSNIGSSVSWFEIEFDAIWILVLPDITPNLDLSNASPQVGIYSFVVPHGVSVRGRNAVFVVSPTGDRDLEYRSAPFLLVDKGWDNSGNTLDSLPPGPALGPEAGPTTGIPGPGVFRRRPLDFSRRR